jgi:hypothetical protein
MVSLFLLLTNERQSCSDLTDGFHHGTNGKPETVKRQHPENTGPEK